MTGRQIGEWLVVDQHISDGPQERAFWNVLCLRCKGFRVASGTNLRKQEKGRRPVLCKECD